MIMPHGHKQNHRKKAWLKIYKKKIVDYLKQILESTSKIKVFVSPFAINLMNHSNKSNNTYWAMLKKQRRTHNRRPLWTLTHGNVSIAWPAKTYTNSVQTQDTVKNTFRELWMIEVADERKRERERERERVCVCVWELHTVSGTW